MSYDSPLSFTRRRVSVAWGLTLTSAFGRAWMTDFKTQGQGCLIQSTQQQLKCCVPCLLSPQHIQCQLLLYVERQLVQ